MSFILQYGVLAKEVTKKAALYSASEHRSCLLGVVACPGISVSEGKDRGTVEAQG